MSFKALMSGPVNLAAPRIFVGGLAVMISASAFAVQDAPPAPAEPAIDPPVVEEPDAPSDPPSLDDLLEIEGESDSGAAAPGRFRVRLTRVALSSSVAASPVLLVRRLARLQCRRALATGDQIGQRTIFCWRP